MGRETRGARAAEKGFLASGTPLSLLLRACGIRRQCLLAVAGNTTVRACCFSCVLQL